MATYTPNNTFVFVAAFTGCQAGILGRVSQTNSDTEETYAPTDLIAGAWAQAIDTAWGVSTNPDLFQYSAIEDLSEVYWLNKNSLPSPADIQRISYTIPASKILLMLLSGENYLSSQSITPPPFPPGGGNSGVIWRPGVPSAGPAVETEAEIIAAVNAADGFITVAIDSSTAPAVLTGVLNGRGALTLTAYNATLGAGPGFVSDILTIADGGQIQRLQTVGNFLGIACDCKTLASLTFGNGDCLTVNAGAIYLTSDATTFAVQVPTGETLQLTALNDSIIGAADTDTLIKLAGTATLILLMLSDSLIDGDAVNGDGGSTLTYSHDDTVPLVTFGAMSGTASEVRLSQARSASPASGTTGQRPTGASLNVGQLYFDTTLNTVIAWNGATWVILGTAPQTPWTSDIDGAGFPLEHVATVTFDTFDNGNSGSAITIDWRRSQKQLLTLTADCTLAFVDPPGAGNFLLMLIQGGTGGHGVTFPAEVGWQGSLVPTPTSAPQAMDAAALAFLPAGLPAPFRYLGSFGPNFGV